MTKKFFLPLLTLLILPFTFTSCSDDDDDKNTDSTESIVGTWYCDVDYMDIDLKFEKNGNFYGYSSYGNTYGDFYGEYSVKGNILTILYCDSSSGNNYYYPPFESGETYKISTTKNKLSLTYVEDGEEDDDPYIFTRISDSDFGDEDEDEDYWK